MQREAAGRQSDAAESRHYAALESMDAGADARPPPAGAARLTAANVTRAWSHIGWLCGGHMAAIQEHGLAQQR
eukprot:15478908-Alexandrium_andersonii.AAC.1